MKDVGERGGRGRKVYVTGAGSDGRRCEGRGDGEAGAAAAGVREGGREGKMSVPADVEMSNQKRRPGKQLTLFFSPWVLSGAQIGNGEQRAKRCASVGVRGGIGQVSAPVRFFIRGATLPRPRVNRGCCESAWLCNVG